MVLANSINEFGVPAEALTCDQRDHASDGDGNNDKNIESTNHTVRLIDIKQEADFEYIDKREYRDHLPRNRVDVDRLIPHLAKPSHRCNVYEKDDKPPHSQSNAMLIVV